MAQDPERVARENLGDVTRQIAALGKMSTQELREKFLDVYGFETRSRNRIYMQKKIAWQIQALAEGGLSPYALERIERLAPLAPARWRPRTEDVQLPAEAEAELNRDPRLPPPGTVIKRKFRGETFEVIVLLEGFEHAGDNYNSLSKVAKAIAGTPWNGYAFFGLGKRPSSKR